MTIKKSRFISTCECGFFSSHAFVVEPCVLFERYQSLEAMLASMPLAWGDCPSCSSKPVLASAKWQVHVPFAQSKIEAASIVEERCLRQFVWFLQTASGPCPASRGKARPRIDCAHPVFVGHTLVRLQVVAWEALAFARVVARPRRIDTNESNVCL